METIELIKLQVNEKARIVSFDGGHQLALKLRQYGLFVGDRVRIVRSAPFNGPILIESNGREIALGKGIAGKIMVEKN
ncbi:MAG TPA: FeoA family protein [Anaerolineales bacterium]|nr:FeoA family protein [Anaerolineales bacterium]